MSTKEIDKVRTLRPGLLVSLKTSISGNVRYSTEDLEHEHLTATGEKRARWETEKVISDPEEFDAAIKIRTKVRSLVIAQCAKSDFGLLCPEDNAAALMDAIAEGRKLADEFNDGAALTRVTVNVLYGRIAQDDVEAVRAISAEVRELMDAMQTGITTLDVKAVRDACNKAKQLGDMLSDDAKERLAEAISVARLAARKIARAGDEVAVEIDAVTIETIDSARTSFLDLEDTEGEAFEITPDTRNIDLEDD